jgi:hypothetical protein
VSVAFGVVGRRCGAVVVAAEEWCCGFVSSGP